MGTENLTAAQLIIAPTAPMLATRYASLQAKRVIKIIKFA
jgi:hypothetical protein